MPPAIVSAIVRGSASVAYDTTMVPSPTSSTSIVPRWNVNIGAVMRYWNRRLPASHTRISSGSAIPVAVRDRPDAPVDGAGGDAGEPLGQPCRVAGEGPHRVGVPADVHVVTDRPERHRRTVESGGRSDGARPRTRLDLGHTDAISTTRALSPLRYAVAATLARTVVEGAAITFVLVGTDRDVTPLRLGVLTACTSAPRC